ncbi:MAG: alkaline phosphatase family protein, partial [Planctomycetota bacterium]
LLVVLEAGCGLSRPIRIELAGDVETPARSVVIFLADGMDHQRFEKLLEADILPNIKKRFVEGGVGVKYPISSMPSITYPNCTSVITGVFPGHHGIMGNFWFDRHTLTTGDYRTYETYRNVNWDFTSHTLYSILADHFTLNIQGHTRRGVTQTIDNSRSFAWYWIIGRYTEADRHVVDSLEEATDTANRVKRWPTVIMTYYPGVDETGHRFGPQSEEYTQALMIIDEAVGRVSKGMKQADLDGSTYYVLISDHGMERVDRDKRIDIIRWLKDVRNLKVWTEMIAAEEYTDRYKLIESYDAVASIDAGRAAMIHMKGKQGWPYRPGPKEVLDWINSPPSILDLPEVGIVFIRDGRDRVRMISRQGNAVFERKQMEGNTQYRIVEYTGDSLGYRSEPRLEPFLGGEWYSSRQWLAATAHTQYPDCVPQAVEMFDSVRTADVVIMAAENANFNPAEVGGHGSCLARDMRIVMYFAGPDLPKGGKIAHARLVDVMPTILGLLGEENRLNTIGPIDGINLAHQLRNANSMN